MYLTCRTGRTEWKAGCQDSKWDKWVMDIGLEWFANTLQIILRSASFVHIGEKRKTIRTWELLYITAPSRALVTYKTCSPIYIVDSSSWFTIQKLAKTLWFSEDRPFFWGGWFFDLSLQIAQRFLGRSLCEFPTKTTRPNGPPAPAPHKDKSDGKRLLGASKNSPNQKGLKAAKCHLSWVNLG